MRTIARMGFLFCLLGVFFVNEPQIAKAAFPMEQGEEQQQLLDLQEGVNESVVLYTTNLSAEVSNVTERLPFNGGTYDIEINNTGAYPLKYRLHGSKHKKDILSGTVSAHTKKQVTGVKIGDVSLILTLFSRKEAGIFCCGRYVNGAEGHVIITYQS